MTAMVCAVCNTRFAGRSDAIYCSPACRQKAHRGRVADRAAAVAAQLADAAPVESGRPARDHAEPRSALESIERSRELCLRSAQACRRASAVVRRASADRLAFATYADAVRSAGESP